MFNAKIYKLKDKLGYIQFTLFTGISESTYICFFFAQNKELNYKPNGYLVSITA